MRNIYRLGVILLAACLAALSACTPEELLNPPRLATQTAQAVRLPTLLATAPPATAPPVMPSATPVPTQLLTVAQEEPTTITVWLNETDERTVEFAETIGAQYMARTGVQVQFLYLDAQQITGLAGTAQLINQLPDLILHNSEQTAGLIADGVLDATAAQSLIDELGAETFMDGALADVPQIDNEVAAVPSDGWQYILLYRSDWFEAAGLPAPTTFGGMLAAADAFYTFDEEGIPRDQLVSGIVVPTEQDAYSTQRVFEWVATANGCRLLDGERRVQFMHPACLDALDFYLSIVNQYSPPDYQTDVTAIKAFLDGRTAMIMSPPSILPMLAGYDETYRPTCDACADDPAYLITHSGMTTELGGQSDFAEQASFAVTTRWGVTVAADDVAADFLRFWYQQAYTDWIALAPERRVPLRITTDSGTDLLAAWGTMPLSGGGESLVELFGADSADMLSRNLTTSERWQASPLQTTIYEQLTIAPILQRMLSGYVGSSQATVDTQNALLEAQQIAPLDP